ncbi:MAG: EAL domain-containing protein [Myxococcales bacterium]|nr:EAL domain-containing protein [Myxococcales bacterium]
MAGDPGKARQLSRMVRMAQALQAAVVVEGVEHAADAAMCLALGATLGQGYLWGRPEDF